MNAHFKDFFVGYLICANIFHRIQNGHIFRRNGEVKLCIFDDAGLVRGLRQRQSILLQAVTDG